MKWMLTKAAGALKLSLILLSGLALSGQLHALPEDRDLPIAITANEGTFRSRSGDASFVGNVHLQQGSLEVWADRLDIRRDPVTGQLLHLQAQGQPARFQELPSVDGDLIKVRGQRIEFQPDQDIIITEGQGVMEQANNEIRADFIRYHLLDETLDVRSARSTDARSDSPQATWIIQPRELD